MTEIQQLHERVSDLKDKHIELTVIVARNHAQLSSTCKATEKDVSRIANELFGNGRPGLTVTMARMQVTQKLMLKAMCAIGGALLTVAAGILVALLS